MAFNRVIRIKVGPQPIPGQFYATGVLISDLNVAFEVKRSITFSDNECSVTIYNAKEDTINNMLTKGNNIRIEVGYEDEEVGLIFAGNIIEANTVYSGTNRITNIKGGGIQRSTDTLNYSTISMSYAANTVLSLPILEVAAALSLTPFGAEIASAIILPNGFTYSGTAKGALYYIRKILKSNGYGMYIDNDILIIYLIGVKDTVRFTFAYLSTQSGLINAFYKDEEFRKGDSVEYKRRVEYKCILNPRLTPNGLVTIEGKTVQGTFINEKVEFKGDNFGGEFTTKGEAVV